MAFNPFHGFRKHQKTLFAIMVIVCMFVFILQFGAGDVFSRLLSWIGAGRGKGTLVTTLNGTKVYETDLGKLSRERDVAAMFVVSAAAQAEPPAPADRMARQSLAQTIVMLYFQARIGPFGNLSRNEDLLDFMLWRTKADKLGIVLTEVDVRKLINRIAGKDVFGGKPFTSSAFVTQVVHQLGSQRQNRAITADELQRAVTEEFRVVLAQEALLGRGPGVFGGNAMFGRAPDSAIPAVTPGEFLQYYREQRTTLNVWMLPLNVNDFLAEARKKPTPSNDDLTRLFDRYKGEVPDPERAKPAFKEPERVKAEWVVAGADLPYFKTLVQLRVDVAPNLTRAFLPAAALTGAAGPAAAMMSIGVPVAYDPLLSKYADYVKDQSPTVLETPLDRKPLLHDRSLVNPTQLAKIVGTLSAGAGSFGSPSLGTVALGWGTAAQFAELHEELRLRTVLEMEILGNVVCPPLNGGILAALAASGYHSPINDMQDMRRRFVAEQKSIEETTTIVKEMEDFVKELTKLKGKSDESKKLIEETVKKYGLRRYAMTTPFDRYQLEKDDKFDPEKDKDAALKKLRDEYLESQGGVSADRFADLLLRELKAPYEPREFHRNRGDVYVVWQTEFVKAKEPKTLAEARDKVIDAYYLEEARNLARRKAEELAAQSRKWQSNLSVPEIEKRLREETKEQGFTLFGVARLTSDKALQGERGRTYTPYTPPASLIAHPRRNMVDQLVKSLKDSGDAMVLGDQPERTYYVAVLESRDNQTDLSNFADVLKGTPFEDTLWTNNFLPQRRRDFEKQVVKQMRIDSGAALNDDGDYVLPEGIRDRAVDRGEGD